LFVPTVSGNSADESISDGNKSGSEGELQKKAAAEMRYGAMMSFSFDFDWTAGLDPSQPLPSALTSSTPVRNDL
jgi:hypothetical protein